MKKSLVILAISFVAVATGTHARAQSYPWCAIYSKSDSDRNCNSFALGRCMITVAGHTNCGFSTLQQCMATVSGLGGFCEPNTQYVPNFERPRSHS
jgi:hypothetical protein